MTRPGVEPSVRKSAGPKCGHLQSALRGTLGVASGVGGAFLVDASMHRPLPVTILGYVAATLLLFASHQILVRWWDGTIGSGSFPPRDYSPPAADALGLSAVALMAIGAVTYAALSTPEPWLTTRHPVAVVVALLGSGAALGRNGLRYILSQLEECPPLVTAVKIDALAAIALTGSAFSSIWSPRPFSLRLLSFVLSVAFAVLSFVFVLDSDVHARRALQSTRTARLTTKILDLRWVARFYDAIDIRLGTSRGTELVRWLLGSGVLLVAASAFAGVPATVASAEKLITPPPITTQHDQSQVNAESPPTTTTTKPAGRPPGGSTSSSPPPPASESSASLFASVCKTFPGGDPQTTPKWIHDDLLDDWLGQYGPGANIAGCPGRLQHVTDANDEVWYQVGTLDGSLLSVGVASAKHGGTLFLADGGAAAYVVSLLDQGIAVSGTGAILGYGRENISNGDAILLFDGEGTTLLIRATKHATGSMDEDTPYVVLPPAAFQGWVDATQRLMRFLWPQYVSGSYTTGGTIALSPVPGGPTVASIAFTPGNGDATLQIGAQSTSYSVLATTYDPQYLTQFAPPPSAGKQTGP
jgi:hypothetical protein